MAEIEQMIKLIMAVILSGLIGYEREKSHKPAGLRTHVVVCIGATLLTIISVDYFFEDNARLVSALVTGLGFLGAGAIIASGRDIKGMTTAATIWFVAMVGIGVGIGWYQLSAMATIIVFILLVLGRFEKIS